MQELPVWPELISTIIPVAGFPNGTVQIDSWTKSKNLSNFEFIFVNDSDEIEVEKKLQEISIDLRKYSKVKVIKSQCRNPGGARNLGLSIAEGSWIVFWDCDDIPDPSKVKEMIVKADGVNSDVTLGGFQIRDGSSQNVKVNKIISGQKILESVAINPGLWRFAFKSDIVKSIEFPEVSMAEDQIFLAEALSKSKHLSFFHEVVYEYWNHPSGQLTKNKEKIRELNPAVDYFYKAYKSTKCLPLLIVIIRLTVTVFKKNAFSDKFVVLLKFLKFIFSRPIEIKNVISSISVIWRFR